MASAKNDPLSHGPLRKGVGGIAVPEPTSWAEILHRQTSANRNRPRPDAEYAMPFRETRYAKSREEVVYNPVLQTFTDPARETLSKRREETRRVANLNQARDRQIARESQFDILNMSDKRSGLGRSDEEVAAAAAAAQAAQPAQPPPKYSAKPTFRHPLDSCYQFNIVSNLPLSQHHYTAPELRPNMDNREEPKPRLQTNTNLPRDYDVLSNRYREGHDAKIALETEVTLPLPLPRPLPPTLNATPTPNRNPTPTPNPHQGGRLRGAARLPDGRLGRRPNPNPNTLTLTRWTGAGVLGFGVEPSGKGNG